MSLTRIIFLLFLSVMDVDLNSKSVRELKTLLDSRGVDYTDCVEKSDLIRKVMDTASLEPNQGTVSSFSRTYGGLSCKVVRNCQQPEYIVILSHGYGANANDLAPIATDALGLTTLKSKKFWFVVPDAPLALPQGGRAWWHIDLQELVQRVMSGQLAQIMAETPAGMSNARESLLGVLNDLKKENPSVSWSRFVIAGFSQGAILSMDVSLHLPREDDSDPSPLNVVCWSGGLMCSQEWEKLVEKRKNIKVIASHGKQDSLLPFMMGKALEQFLQKYGIPVEFMSFDGGHQLPSQTISRFVKLLEGL